METSLHKDTASTRAGFTLIELLAVMLLIMTILGMGVPAMFAAERKSYVNEAMSSLVRTHQACVAMQLYLAAIGDPGTIRLTIANVASNFQANVKVENGTTSFNPSKWIGTTLTTSLANEYDASISADQFVSDITATGPLTWSYQQQTGFTSFIGVNIISFKALPSGPTFKVVRTLKLYPQGYAEIP